MALSTSGNLRCIIVAAAGRVPGGGAEESPHLLAHVVVLRESAAVRLVEGAGAPRLKAGAATHGVAVPPANVLLAVEDRHVVLVWKHALRAGHARTGLVQHAAVRTCHAGARRAHQVSVAVGAEEAAVCRAVLAAGKKNSGLATTTFFREAGWEEKMVRTQRAVIMLTGYAFYLAVYCPCVRTMSCHLPQFYSSMGLALLLVAWENRKM